MRTTLTNHSGHWRGWRLEGRSFRGACAIDAGKLEDLLIWLQAECTSTRSDTHVRRNWVSWPVGQVHLTSYMGQRTFDVGRRRKCQMSAVPCTMSNAPDPLAGLTVDRTAPFTLTNVDAHRFKGVS
jgi:hypothetical protein